MILTAEIKDGGDSSLAEVAICFDEEGLDLLMQKLMYLRQKVEHAHLMTPSWSGHELTENKQGGDKFSLVNHLILVKL